MGLSVRLLQGLQSVLCSCGPDSPWPILLMAFSGGTRNFPAAQSTGETRSGGPALGGSQVPSPASPPPHPTGSHHISAPLPSTPNLSHQRHVSQRRIESCLRCLGSSPCHPVGEKIMGRGRESRARAGRGQEGVADMLPLPPKGLVTLACRGPDREPPRLASQPDWQCSVPWTPLTLQGMHSLAYGGFKAR